jgi:hypothetical protein
MNYIQDSNVPYGYFPIKMGREQIAAERDQEVQVCLIIMYSQRTTQWEKNFAREQAYRQIWRLEHHWLVSSDNAHHSEKVFNLLTKISRERNLNISAISADDTNA